jgi:hypothetical protein
MAGLIINPYQVVPGGPAKDPWSTDFDDDGGWLSGGGANGQRFRSDAANPGGGTDTLASGVRTITTVSGHNWGATNNVLYKALPTLSLPCTLEWKIRPNNTNAAKAYVLGANVRRWTGTGWTGGIGLGLRTDYATDNAIIAENWTQWGVGYTHGAGNPNGNVWRWHRLRLLTNQNAEALTSADGITWTSRNTRTNMQSLMGGLPTHVCFEAYVWAGGGGATTLTLGLDYVYLYPGTV